MKSHLPFLVLAVASLVACAGKDSGSPAPSPVAPGTLETSTASPALGLGSYQGAILNSDNEAQAVLTLDVWQKDSITNAQLTVSPGGATAVIPLDNGAQSFNATLDAQTAGIIVKGSWNGSTWTGVVTNGSATNSFTLKAGASSQAAVAVGVPSGTFDGTLTYKESGGVQKVSLVLSTPNKLGDVLAQTLTSKVVLSAVIKYSPTYNETLKNVVWDRDTSTLKAEGTIATSLGVAGLSCKLAEMNAGDKDVLQCALSNSKGPVATGALSQKRVVVAPPYVTDPGTQPPVQPNPVPQPTPPPAPTPYAPTPAPMPTATPPPPPTPIPVPVPTPTLTVKNEKVFVGNGVFTNEQGASQTRTLSLTVSLRDVVLGVDQEAVVKFIIDGSRVGAKFTDATYNGATGQLRAKEILTLGPIAGALRLTCGGVPFAAGAYNFVCHYESSVTNVTGEFRLQGTLN